MRTTIFSLAFLAFPLTSLAIIGTPNGSWNNSDNLPYNDQNRWHWDQRPNSWCGRIFDTPDVKTCVYLTKYCLYLAYNDGCNGDDLINTYYMVSDADQSYQGTWGEGDSCRVNQHQRRYRQYTRSEYTNDCKSIRDKLWQAALTLYEGTEPTVEGDFPLIDSGALSDAFNNLGHQPGYASSCGYSNQYCWYALWCILYTIMDLEQQHYLITGSTLN